MPRTSCKRRMPILLHIDLDAFFASCEHVRRDTDKAIVVCIYSDRGGDSGAVSAADYAARDHGIHAGMPIHQAKQVAADTDEAFLFLDADKEHYRTVAGRIRDIIRDHVQELEPASIDESYADVSHLDGYDAAAETAHRIRQEIAAQEDVTASIGIGPNKLIAKIASDQDKPDGTTVVRPDAVAEFLADRPVDALHGVGPKTAATLQEMGYGTVDALQEADVQQLIATFGETRGVALHEKAHGRGETTLEDDDPTQLSRIRTLPHDMDAMQELRPVIRDLAGAVHDRVQEHGVRYGTVTAILVPAGGDMRTRSRSLKAATDTQEPLYREAEELVATFLDNHPDATLRRVGVRAADLATGNQATLDAF